MQGAHSNRPSGLPATGVSAAGSQPLPQNRAWSRELPRALRGLDEAGRPGFAGPTGWHAQPTRSLADLKACEGALQGSVAQEIRATVSHELAQTYIEEVSRKISGIFARAIDGEQTGSESPRGARVSKGAFERAVVDANQEAQQYLIDLERGAYRKQIDGTDMKGVGAGDPDAPQFFMGSNKQVNVMRTAPGIEGMVFRGGGAKGAGYAPSLAVMEERGQLRDLKHVVGTSAGSLTAMCMATGFNAAQFDEFVGQTGMDVLSRRVSDFSTRYPSVTISGMCRHSGEGALVALDDGAAKSVSSHLRSLWKAPTFQAKLARLTPEQVSRLNTLRNPDLSPQADRTEEMITFRDLQLLHTLEPDRFRELTITGWNATRASLEYFSAESHPDMPVALAARISMAIPPLFDPVYYKAADAAPDSGIVNTVRRALGLKVEAKAQKFVDGGFGNNVPTEVFTTGKTGRALEEVRARTAVLVFDEQGKAHNQIHTREPNEPATVWKKFFRTISRGVKAMNNPNHAQVSEGDKRKPLEAGVNALVVHHGDLDTFDTMAGPARIASARRDAELRMLQQMRLRSEQAYVVAYDTPEACVQALSKPERSALLAKGEPVRSATKTDELFQFELAVYRLVTASAGAGF